MKSETQEAPKKQIHFHMREDLINALTWEEYEALELAQEGELVLHRIRPLLARFVVNDENIPVDHKAAMRLIAKVPMDQIKDVIAAFLDALKEKAVPKENGG